MGNKVALPPPPPGAAVTMPLPSPRPRFGYVYVAQSEVASILTHGYLSAAALYRTLGALPDAFLQKYEGQIQEALETYANEAWALQKNRAFMGAPNPSLRTLAYLDWRMDDVHPTPLRGSHAVYFLYAPIPEDEGVRAFIKENRGDFLRGRVLLRLDLGHAGTAYEVSPGAAVPNEGESGEAFWLRAWRLAQARQKGTEALWFQDIPHAYCVPPDGLIPPHGIKVL